MKKMMRAALLWMFLAVLVVATAVGIVWAIWHFGMQRVAPDTARAWALIVTAMLPVTALLFWWLGHTEARGRLAGIDDAVDKVMKAALKTSQVRNRRSTTQPQRPDPGQWAPTGQVEILEPRRLSQDDVIEI